MWKEIEQTYLPWYDYGDLPTESSGRLWQQKAHIYQCPFYYIDYCLALTGALQFWTKSRTDAEGTLKTYDELCTLGGSLDYNGLLSRRVCAPPLSRAASTRSSRMRNGISSSRYYLISAPARTRGNGVLSPTDAC